MITLKARTIKLGKEAKAEGRTKEAGTYNYVYLPLPCAFIRLKTGEASGKNVEYSDCFNVQ